MDPFSIAVLIAVFGYTAREFGGDANAWIRGEQAPSQERWLKNHDRKMERLRFQQAAGVPVRYPSAAPGYMIRIWDNAFQRWADNSVQKTRENQEFLITYGADVAKRRARLRYWRFRRREEIAIIWGTVLDETIESLKESQARRQNARFGGPVGFAPPKEEPEPAPEKAAEPLQIQTPAAPPVVIVIKETVKGQTREGKYSPPPPPPPPTQPDPPPEPGPEPVDPVRAHAERIYENGPQLDRAAQAEPAAPATEPLQLTQGSENDPIDAELVDEPGTPATDTGPMATVTPITAAKGTTGMAKIEGGIEGVIDTLNGYAEHLEVVRGSVITTKEALETANWSGVTIDSLETAQKQIGALIDTLVTGANSVSTGGYATRDVLEAHDQVGDDDSVRAQ